MGSKETGFSYCGKGKDTGLTGIDDIMYVSSDERKVINQMYRLKEQYPDQVTIRVEPQDNFGCIVGSVPRSWVVIRVPPKGHELSDEQRQKAIESLKKYREENRQAREEDNDD